MRGGVNNEGASRPIFQGSARASRAGRGAPASAVACNFPLTAGHSTRPTRTARAGREAAHPHFQFHRSSAAREARALPREIICMDTA